MGLDDEEYARDDAARAEEEWGSELEREAEDRAVQKSARHDGLTDVEVAEVIVEGLQLGGNLEHQGAEKLAELLRELAELRAAKEELKATREAEIDEALRRQAAAAIRRVELSGPLGVELGAALALVPADYALEIVHGARGYLAMYQRPTAADVEGHGQGQTREAAILAATAELLGLNEGALRRRCSGSLAAVVRAAIEWADGVCQRSTTGCAAWSWTAVEQRLLDAVEQLRASTAAEPRGTCESCDRWSGGEPATGGPGIARWCSLVAGYRQPDAWCDDHCSVATADTDPVPSSDEPAEKCWYCEPGCPEHVDQLPGVTLTGNLIRSEGDGGA